MNKKQQLPATERLAENIISLGRWFGWVCVISLVLSIVAVDNSDRGFWHRSGMDIKHDCLTGVEYLSSGGSLTPRLDEQGHIMVRECNGHD